MMTMSTILYTFSIRSLHSSPPSLLRRQRLHIPDHVRILLDAAIAAEEAHPRYTRDALANPLLLVFIRLIHQFLRLDIAVEIIADEIVVAVVGDAVA